MAGGVRPFPSAVAAPRSGAFSPISEGFRSGFPGAEKPHYPWSWPAFPAEPQGFLIRLQGRFRVVIDLVEKTNLYGSQGPAGDLGPMTPAWGELPRGPKGGEAGSSGPGRAREPLRPPRPRALRAGMCAGGGRFFRGYSGHFSGFFGSFRRDLRPSEIRVWAFVSL